MPEQEITERILLLQDQGKIVLRDQLPLSFTLKDYMLSFHAYWYLTIIVLAATTATLILANLERAPIIGGMLLYVRLPFRVNIRPFPSWLQLHQSSVSGEGD